MIQIGMPLQTGMPPQQTAIVPQSTFPIHESFFSGDLAVAFIGALATLGAAYLSYLAIKSKKS